jgi:hypothetical protein
LAVITLLLVTRSAASAAHDQTPQEQVVPASALITQSATAIRYEVGGGSTKVDLKGTELMPDGGGQARVEIKAKAGATSVDVEVKDLKPPSTLGSEFLTYVLWAVTPEGRTGNMGEILFNKNGDGKLSATTPAQTLSLVMWDFSFWQQDLLPIKVIFLLCSPKR